MNALMVSKMLLNRQCRQTFRQLHKRFSESSDYRARNMVACGLNVIKHDRLVTHDGQILVNSFIPPLNSEAFRNMVMQVPGEGEAFFDNHAQGLRKAPISTYVAVTDACRYSCWHCSAQRRNVQVEGGEVGKGSEGQPAGGSDAAGSLSTGQMLYIVEQLQLLGVSIIGLTGGEPLLRDDLETIIAAVRPTSVAYVFSTGYGLGYERACALKRAGLSGIAISVDSPNAADHDALRQYEGAFQIAIDAIVNAKKAGLYTMSQTVATKKTLQNGDLERLALLLKTLAVDEMRIMEPLPCGKLRGDRHSTLAAEEVEALKKLHITFNSSRSHIKASVFPYFESDEQFGCGAGTQHSYVDSRGNFGPCDFIDKAFGNLLDQDVFEIWKRMHVACGGPNCGCLAKCGLRSEGRMPLFYRLMKGAK
ncbi:MAG: radical SAM protein [Actinomycetia bacterium]|nr:radical SAM protein [Actinomycetes bacterium]